MRNRIRLGVGAATLAAFISSIAPAAADASSVPAAWQTKALAVAERVWHPACGQLTLTFSDPTGVNTQRDDPAGMGQDFNSADAAGWTAIGDCHININQNGTWMGFPDFCTVVLHEAGHSAGAPDTNGKGIMSIAVPGAIDAIMIWKPSAHAPLHQWVWAGVDRRCVRRMDGHWSS